MSHPRIRIILAGSLPLLASTAVIAQEVIEEVVVTSQRREQSAQDLPASLTAFTSKSLEEFGVRDAVGLAAQTPGLNANFSSGDSNPIFTIRGIGLNDTFSNNNPTASVYLDEVLVPFSPMLSMSLYDIQRVEVLKGPQGTLYGRNTTGGAINLITAKPNSETEGFVRAGFSRFDRADLEGAVGGALSETLNGRFSFMGTRQTSGWQHNAFNDTTVGDKKQYAARGQLAWQGDEHTSALLRIDWASDKSDNQLREHVGSYSAPFSFTPCQATLDGRRDEANCVDFLGYSDPTPSRRTVEDSSFYGYDRDSDLFGAGLTVSHEFESFTLTSVSGYWDFNRVLNDDSDGSPLIQLDSRFSDDIRAFTQELRVASAASSPVRWVGGVYFSDDSIKGDILQALDQHIFLTRVDTNWKQDTRSVAAFGQAEWPLTEQLRLTTGLRYTHEKKDIRYDSVDLDPFGTSQNLPTPVAGIRNSISKNNVSGKIGLDYHVSEDVMVYASASRGFKSGGFKAAIAFNPSELDPFEPEKLNAYEAGLKSTLADGHLRFNTAAYYYDWKSFQAFVTENRSGINVVVLSNAGDAEVKGIEAELTWLPLDGLSITLGGNVMDTEIVRYTGVAGTGDFTGNKLANSPKSSWNGAVRYEFPLGGNLRAYLLGSARWQDDQYFTVANNPQASQRAYGVFNARAALTDSDGKWEVALWGENLGNKLFITQAYDNYPGIFPSQYFLGDPRTYGLSVLYRFK